MHARHLFGCLTLAAMAMPAHAGRPLSVEDAGVNPVGQCQVEAWAERAQASGSDTLWVAAPACGVIEGLEVGVEFGVPSHRRQGDAHRSVALKWVPEAAQWGAWHFGAKLSAGSERVASEEKWSDTPVSLLGIGSWQAHEQLTLHVNLGVDHRRKPSDTTGHAGLALAWQPHERWLVFAELTAEEKVTPVRGAGLRHWLVPEVLGLDFTVSRSNAVRDSTTYTVGIGWYGIKF